MPFLRGEISPPGDKSITHRALLFSSLVKGRVHIEHALLSGDTRSTAKALAKLGLSLNIDDQGAAATIDVVSPGIEKLRESILNESEMLQSTPINFDCGNSGTTTRLLAGLCAGLSGGVFRFDGDASLRSRDMSRILSPLQSMGCEVEYLGAQGYAPFQIKAKDLHSKDIDLKISSSQVSSALLLAGLVGVAQGGGRNCMTVSTPFTVRDHTFRLLKFMGANIEECGVNSYKVFSLASDLAPCRIVVPGDISSCAFFLSGAAVMPGSSLLLKGVGVNPGRILVMDTLARMGVSILKENSRLVCGEPVCDLHVQSTLGVRLRPCNIEAASIPSGIDEIPAIALAFAFADGRSVVSGAEELKHKESNRLRLIIENFANAGVRIEETSDGFFIEGSRTIAGGSFWRTNSDHRLAMLGMVASLAFERPLIIEEVDSAAVSYPGFSRDLAVLVNI